MLDKPHLQFRLGLLYLFAILAALGIAPFIVLRYWQGDYLHALVDLTIVAVALFNGVYSYKAQHVSPLTLSLTSAIYTLGAIAVAYLNNPIFCFWLFPALFANVFLLRALPALLVNLAAVAAITPVAMSLSNPVDTMGLIASLLFSISLAYIFALQNERQQALLERSAALDPLTELANRRGLNLTLQECLGDFKRKGTPATLIIFDLDFFKQINDRFGHSIGDELLQKLAQLLTLRIRASDRAFRFGGEEFIILARNTPLDEARRFAEHLRVNINLELIPPEGEITASFGCAELRAGESLDHWFNRADKAVYAAKARGRNCVVCAEDETS